MYDISSCRASLATVSLKCPFTSVTTVEVSRLPKAPVLVTVAPGNGSPVSSVTMPAMSRLAGCWCVACRVTGCRRMSTMRPRTV